ncbi:hypothetical protein [Clostridium sp. DL1XJH146]
MEMTLNYSGAFCELGYDELDFVNGGGITTVIAYTTAGTICFCGGLFLTLVSLESFLCTVATFGVSSAVGFEAAGTAVTLYGMSIDCFSKAINATRR